MQKRGNYDSMYRISQYSVEDVSNKKKKFKLIAIMRTCEAVRRGVDEGKGWVVYRMQNVERVMQLPTLHCTVLHYTVPYCTAMI